MVDILNIEGYTFDKEALRLAADEYSRLKGTEEYTEDYKWEVFEELNNWFEENEINEDNVVEYVEFLKEKNKGSGYFVHWSLLDDLSKFAEENPKGLANLLISLYHGEESLEKRISDFREELELGTPAFGYLMAAYDIDEYAPIKVEQISDFFKDFADQMPEKIRSHSIPKKYSLYHKYCHKMAEFLEEEGVVEEGTALDSQDFYYTIETYDQINKELMYLKYLWKFSKRLNEFKSDSESLINEIKSLPVDFLKDIREYYEDTEKVRKVRYRALDEWIEKGEANIDKIKEEVNSEYDTNILNSWKDFTIYGQIYVDYFKDKLDNYFQTLAEYFVEDIGIEGLDYHIVTFQGVQNFITEKPWMLIYPEEKGDHRDSYQFFFRILPEKVEHGFSYGENIEDFEFENEEKYVEGFDGIEELNLDKILQNYKSFSDEFVAKNKLDKEEFSVEDVSIWQIAPGEEGEELWEPCSKNDLIAIGWDEVKNQRLDEVTKEEIGELMGKDPDQSNDVKSLYYFGNEIGDGDIVIAKKGNSKDIYGIGVVTGDYYQDHEKMNEIFPDGIETYEHFLPVEWVIDFVSEEGKRIEVDLSSEFVQYTLERFKSNWEELKEKVIDRYPEYEDRFSEIEKVSENIIEGAYEKSTKGKTNYFWVTANPDRWSVSKIEDGGEVFYTAYSEKGNKRRMFEAFQKAKPGDEVLFYESTPVKKIVAEGKISEGMHTEYREEYEEEKKGISVKYKEPVNDISWDMITDVPNLEDSHPVANRAQGSIFELTEEEYRTILALEPDIPVKEKTEEEMILEKNDADLEFEDPDFTGGLHFPSQMQNEINQSIRSALRAGKNIIFTGPPGTGKTKIARNVADEIDDECECVDGFKFTTATADWTTFDTIGGYQPSKEDDSLSFKPGQFLKCFREKDGNPVNKWLIIDEINRADIDKAFGQLFSVLSNDDVELPFTDDEEDSIWIKSLNDKKDEIEDYSDSDYYVTRNWRLLATMNTYDKASLYEMSYAFMRRFAFIDVSVPTEDIERDLMEDYISVWDGVDEEGVSDHLEDLEDIWKVLNEGKRSIGPAIIKDMLLFLQENDGGDGLVNALKLYVLPQLEGMVKQDQREIFENIIDEVGKRDKLAKVAKERFEIDLKEKENE